jgi:hypothetical protein
MRATKSILFAAVALLAAAACASAAPEDDVAQSGRFTTLSTAPVAAAEAIQLPGSDEFLLVVRELFFLSGVARFRARSRAHAKTQSKHVNARLNPPPPQPQQKKHNRTFGTTTKGRRLS